MWPSVWAWLEAFAYMILNAFNATFAVAMSFTYDMTHWLNQYLKNTWQWTRYAVNELQKTFLATVQSVTALADTILTPLVNNVASAFGEINTLILPDLRSLAHVVASGMFGVFGGIFSTINALVYVAQNLPAAILQAREFIGQALTTVDNAIHEAETRAHDAVETLRVHGRGMAKWINFTHHESGVFRTDPAFWSLFPIRGKIVELLVETMTDQQAAADSRAFDKAYNPPSPEDVAVSFGKGEFDQHPAILAAVKLFHDGNAGLRTGL